MEARTRSPHLLIACLSVLSATPCAYGQSYSRTEVIEYHDDLATYVLGQIKKTTCAAAAPTHTACDGQADSVMSQVDYGWKALPWKTYSFGKLEETFSYETSLAGQLGTLKTVTDGNSNITTLTNWKRGIPQSIKYPATPEAPGGAMQVANVDNNGWISTINDENGYRTCYDYDDMGRVEKIRYPSETTSGACDPGEGSSSRWAATTFAFALNAVGKYGVPANHWRLVESTGAARKITYFDALWRPVVEETFDFTNATTADATRSLTVKRYDSAGQLAFQSYPMTTVSNFTASSLTGTHTSYDALGRVRIVDQDWEGGTPRLRTTTTYLNNSNGVYTLVTDPNLNQTRTWFQAFDEPRYDSPTTIWHPEGAYTHINRDPFGKMITLRRSNSSSATAGTIAIDRRYYYDLHQRLCRSMEPETGSTVIQYDGANNVAWSASGLSLPATTACYHAQAQTSSRRVDRTYDGRNRISTLAFPDGLGNTTYTYTRDGKQNTILADNGGSDQVTTQYTYNRRRLLERERMTWGNIDWSISYLHNGNGHLASQTSHGGFEVAYAPNALGQPTQAGSYATAVTYFPNGAIKQFTYGNGIVHRMEQNARQLPSRSVDFYGSSVKRLDDHYDYDANGNVLAITDALPGNRGNRDMTYDGLDRLKTTVSPMFGTATYTYDVLDNLTRVSVTGGNQPRNHFYCYDASWRLTNVKTGSCAGTSVMGLGYDVQGNLENRNGRTFSFDYGNRLRRAGASGATPATSYVYDGLGLRVRDVTGASKYSMYSRAGQLTFVSDLRQSLQSWYVHLGGSLVATRERDTVTGSAIVKYHHTDALGSPVATTSSTRAVVERTENEPFGHPTNRVSQDGPGYTGHVEDAATGMNYMQQRYYDPQLGRFLSVDPVTPHSDTGGNFSRYWYAANNPYRFSDPDGRQAIDETKAAPPKDAATETKTLATISVTASRPTIASTPAVGWGHIGRSLVQGGSLSLIFISGMWPNDMGYSACEMQGSGACGRVYSEAAPQEPNLTKVKEREGNKVAQDAGYDDAHDAKKGRGEGGVDIYKDKSTGKYWLWNGVPGGEKETL